MRTGLFGLSARLALLVIPATALAGWGIVWLVRQAGAQTQQVAAKAHQLNQDSATQAGAYGEGMITSSRAAATTVDAVRQMQIHLRLQVLAFKNVILRGVRPDQLALWRAAFDRERDLVIAGLATLKPGLAGDPAATAVLTKFAEAHQQLTVSWINAMGMIDLAETWDEGMRRADDYMVGRDVAADTLIAELTERVITASQVALSTAEAAGRQLMVAAMAAGEEAMSATAAEAQRENLKKAWIAGGTLIVLGLLLLLIIWSRIRHLRLIVAAVEGIAAGDLSQRVRIRGTDEIGRTAAALNDAGAAIAETLGAERVDWQQIAAARKGEAARLSGELQRTSAELAASGDANAATSTELDAQVRTVASRWQEVSARLHAVSGSVGELDAALGDVGRNAASTTAAVSQAQSGASGAASRVDELTAAGEKVSEAVAMVEGLARQVNLLALNATIEAARAGEAGRGFTVVAHEVKALARRTAETASGIAETARGMHEVSARTTQDIAAIAASLSEVGTLASELATAVERQAGLSRLMADGLSSAVAEGADLDQAAGNLAAASAATAAGAETSRTAAAALGILAGDLRRVLGVSNVQPGSG